MQELNLLSGQTSFFTIEAGNYTPRSMIQLLNENLQFCTLVQTHIIDEFRSHFTFTLTDEEGNASVKLIGSPEFFFISGFHGLGRVLASGGDLEFILEKENEGKEYKMDYISHLLNMTVYFQSLGLNNSCGIQIGSVSFTNAEMQTLLLGKHSMSTFYPHQKNGQSLYSHANSCRFFIQNSLHINVLCDFFCVECDINLPEDILPINPF